MIDGICNLQRHAENMKKYGVPVIITANRFPSDTDAEIAELKAWCINNGYRFAINEGAIKGSEGAVELANEVNKVLGEETSQNFKPIYPIGDKGWSIRDKIGKICHEIYKAAYVEYTDLAQEQIKQYEEMGYSDLAICMAKTPSSFSDDAKLLGAPEDFVITVREVRLSAGAGFIVPLTGSVMTMPGLPKNPLACRM
jgi:formate--tetrahydrofolate ligase